MQHKCSSLEMKANIKDTLKSAFSKHVYLYSCAGWFTSKVIHDWCLLCGVMPFHTLKIGLLSLVFQVTAAATAFLWSMGVAEVFVAPVPHSDCACYYKLPQLQTVLAFATPALLFSLTVKKLASTLRAAAFGDYLYCVQYDVAYHVVLISIKILT